MYTRKLNISTYSFFPLSARHTALRTTWYSDHFHRCRLSLEFHRNVSCANSAVIGIPSFFQRPRCHINPETAHSRAIAILSDVGSMMIRPPSPTSQPEKRLTSFGSFCARESTRATSPALRYSSRTDCTSDGNSVAQHKSMANEYGAGPTSPHFVPQRIYVVGSRSKTIPP